MLVPEPVNIRLGAEGSGADEWKAEAAEHEAARLRLAGAAVDIFNPEELPAHLVRTAPRFFARLTTAVRIERSRPCLCASRANVFTLKFAGQQALPVVSSMMRLLAPMPSAAGNGEADADEAGDGESDDANALTVHRDNPDDQYREEKKSSPPPPRPTPSGSAGGYAAPRPRPAGFAVGGRTRNGPNVRAVGGSGR